MSSRSLISLIIPLFIVSCMKEELSERPRIPPIQNVAADASSSILPINTFVKDYNPDTVCHELIQINSSAWDPGQWALGIESKYGGFYPILFFLRDTYARSCQVWYPSLEVRQWRKGLWIKS